ncbi:hypothetical protein [Peribacillus asahii]|uniref:hypothetical protein n=1 Tax=Peribacillus asahii TaxID=228899 RepID=UPI00207AAFA6|nr:hypothetical protein [Peribacillus asahii]USK61354.1 hypothetical protein LIT37_08565 [Peribacillus asahii]
MNNNLIIDITCQYRNIIFALMDALEENNLEYLTNVIKKDVLEIDNQVRQVSELKRIL